jgi:aminoglycoside/choline kinase family phosphotransferase
MKQSVEKKIAAQSCRMLDDAWQLARVQVEPLTPDGSLRRFCRLRHEDGRSVMAVAPPAGDINGLAEAISGWNIGRHLWACEVPVPELYGFDEQGGLLLCEDLGDTRLHDLVVGQECSPADITALYRQVVAELARMQVRGRENFDCSWCWDTARYDRRLMLERESGYFLQALCLDLLQLPVVEQEISQEFAALADRAAQADGSFFLHRDFQSRNIMVHQGSVRFIDYQAGRLGPAAYDLASLLIDPYASLTESVQRELLEHYLDVLTDLVFYDRQQFMAEYLILAIQRNLQILGAFAFLSNQRGKSFFRQYIKPALYSLGHLLVRTKPAEYPRLKVLVEQCLDAVRCI